MVRSRAKHGVSNQWRRSVHALILPLLDGLHRSGALAERLLGVRADVVIILAGVNFGELVVQPIHADVVAGFADRSRSGLHGDRAKNREAESDDENCAHFQFPGVLSGNSFKVAGSVNFLELLLLDGWRRIGAPNRSPA